MPRAAGVCTESACPNPAPSGGRCDECRDAANRTRRRTPEQRAYKSRAHARFRSAVLSRDPICVICHRAPSTVADHYPVSRRDLVAEGRNPDDPAAGRGTCGACHNASTAARQPGGWNAR